MGETASPQTSPFDVWKVSGPSQAKYGNLIKVSIYNHPRFQCGIEHDLYVVYIYKIIRYIFIDIYRNYHQIWVHVPSSRLHQKPQLLAQWNAMDQYLQHVHLWRKKSIHKQLLKPVDICRLQKPTSF